MRTLLLTFLLVLIAVRLYAGQSMILESEGYACMGDDKSRKQTELMAFQDGKRKATESATTFVQSETRVKDGLLEKDLINAYANAQVKILRELLKEWYKEQGLGDCYRVKLKVEVIPDKAALPKKSLDALEQDPAAPLSVKVWTDRSSYAEGERVRVYLKGNKPFYGRVIYRQANGSLVQLLPNPYREQNYFNGGAVYELPSGEDRFDMETCAPFGNEEITLYASTAQLGSIDVVAAGSVYQVVSKPADIPVRTRGIKLVQKNESSSAPVPAEFAESSANVQTRGR